MNGRLPLLMVVMVGASLAAPILASAGDKPPGNKGVPHEGADFAGDKAWPQKNKSGNQKPANGKANPAKPAEKRKKTPLEDYLRSPDFDGGKPADQKQQEKQNGKPRSAQVQLKQRF